MRQIDLDNEGSRKELMEMLAGCDDTPAYIQRGKRTEEAFEMLLQRCRLDRERFLEFPRMRLATLGCLIDHEWNRLDGEYLLGKIDSRHLRELHDAWQPALRVKITPTDSSRKIRKALSSLVDSFELFNQRWVAHLREIDLRPINKIRVDYNLYYVTEKACAFQNERLAKQGFVELPPVTPETLAADFPPLEIPQLS